jgi:hypothetical protein
VRSCLTAVLVLLSMLLTSAVAKAADSPWIAQDPHDYRCVPRPKDLATPPPPVKFTGPQAAIPAPPQLCTDDEVVESATTADVAKAPPPGFPLTDSGYQEYVRRFGVAKARALRAAVARTAARKATTGRTARAHATMVNQYGAWYAYAEGTQTLPWTSGTIGLYGSQTIEDPFFNTPEGGHTLSQLWAIDGTVGGWFSDVELGWTEDPTAFAATANPWAPHLFVFSFDGGTPGCYNGCTSGRGYFQSAGASVYPGMQLGCCGTVVQLAVQRYGTNWWVNVAGTWVGYFPQSSYPSYFNYGSRHCRPAARSPLTRRPPRARTWATATGERRATPRTGRPCSG